MRVDEAIKLLKDRATAKFDETIEVAMNLGVDPRHADQMVRGVVNLPNGTGKTCASPCSPRAPRPKRPRPPAPTSSAPKTCSRSCRSGNDRFRPLHRHAGHDGARRPSRQGARPARPDAEPEGRHGDRRTSPKRSRPPRAAQSSSASKRPASSMPASARRRSTPRRSKRTSTPSPMPSSRPSRPAPRATTSRRWRSPRRWARASRSTSRRLAASLIELIRIGRKRLIRKRIPGLTGPDTGSRKASGHPVRDCRRSS